MCIQYIDRFRNCNTDFSRNETVNFLRYESIYVGIFSDYALVDRSICAAAQPTWFTYMVCSRTL
jgi:hypothetical protein